MVPPTIGNQIIPLQARPLDPSKDLAAYGYGSVAWKERIELWKQKQDKLQKVKDKNSNEDRDNNVDDKELPL